MCDLNETLYKFQYPSDVYLMSPNRSQVINEQMASLFVKMEEKGIGQEGMAWRKKKKKEKKERDGGCCCCSYILYVYCIFSACV